ncbi:uncharacterized protein LY89DRAFT_145582 [Mollisia scopiformis]|uniref:Methyltransferase domain-containing protein n=1 Tax=Mollisia scopiformis TaxID=149040 RepID=A0A194X0G3_MOLSC|nr:uncharacterized protein LY89DRAFT_145582 [Mollisia scopiformis]KUJ13691.1 hypothetical protein LY89DRAFT_145582 [Mollisia scopiformis]
MTTSEEPSYILRHNKTATESERLDQQHHFISSFTPGFVSPAIPRAKLVNIADIATGTGIWLRELSSTLSHDQPNDRAAPSYTGFDISSSFFPTDLGPDFKFVQHDILQPFPKEYHGNYDLVHLRLLVGAVLEKQLPIALRNVIELLGHTWRLSPMGRVALHQNAFRSRPP